MLPFDLHVLGLPPAFTLSQDQTLHLKLHGPKAKYFSAESVQLTYSLYVYLRTNTLNHVICSNVCLWTTVHSPDARTSHLRTLSKIVGAGLSAFPFRPNT